MTASIRTGIGGWNYAPWRDNFYPAGLPQKKELEYASRQLGAIEINATFYGSQSPASFARWRDETPDGFVFAVKATRFATHRRILAEAGESVRKFIDSGITELRDKLGPLVWQFDARKKFEPDDFAAFLDLLPAQLDGRPLRHALDVRHPGFACAEFVRLARGRGMAIVCNDAEEFPCIADVTGDFVYARLMRAQATVTTGYPQAALDTWARRARQWSTGKTPEDLPLIDAAAKPVARDVFLFVISGAKERAPAAALALAERLR